MTDLISKVVSRGRTRRSFAIAGSLLLFASACEQADGVIVTDPSPHAATPATLWRVAERGLPTDFGGEIADLKSGPLQLAGIPIEYGMNLTGSVHTDNRAILDASTPLLGAASLANVFRDLTTIGIGPYELVTGSIAELASFPISSNLAALDIPAPGALPATPTPKDSIPEPATIAIGLAIAVLIFGNLGKSFLRCWRMTGANTWSK